MKTLCHGHAECMAQQSLLLGYVSSPEPPRSCLTVQPETARDKFSTPAPKSAAWSERKILTKETCFSLLSLGNCSGSSLCPDQVLLSKSFYSRPGCRPSELRNCLHLHSLFCETSCSQQGVIWALGPKVEKMFDNIVLGRSP